MMKYIIVIVSFLLEFFFLNYIGYVDLLNPFFTLVSLVVVYRLFEKRNSYDTFVNILSLFYGLFFLNNMPLGFLLFFIIKEVIILFYSRVKVNWMMNVLLVFIVLLLYNGLFYLILFMPFNIGILFNIVVNSILLNIFIGLVLYPVVFSSKKY